MTTYNAAAVADAVIDYQKGITLQQGRALRDNPLAINEGSSGAPYMAWAWHPYDGVTVGDGNTGLVYNFAVSGAVGSVVTPNFVDGYEYMLEYSGLSCSINGNDIQFYAYKETAAAYAGAVTLASATNSALSYGGFVEILGPRVSRQQHFMNCYSTSSLSSGAAGSIQQSFASSGDKMLAAKIQFSGGNIDGGYIAMYRRRCFLG